MFALIAATLEEASPLVEALCARSVAQTPFNTYRFDAAGNRPGGLLLISGMGPVAAAAAVTHAVSKLGAGTIVNFGACGALSDSTVPGLIYAVTTVSDGDSPTSQPVALVPGGWGTLSSATLVSAAEPVFGGPRREAAARLGDLVDMEGYAVAATATRLGAKCILIKGVTDAASHGDRETLRRNLAAVSQKIAEVVISGLPALAAPRGGVFRRLMALINVEHSIFSLPLLFAGAWLGAGGSLPTVGKVVLVIVAGVAARAMGMAANRLLDRDLDALNRRTASRELAAGTMSPLAGWMLVFGSLVVYVAACAALGPLCLKLSPIPAALLVGYSLLKRVTPLCHYGIGLCMALAPLGAHVAVRGDLSIELPALLTAAFAFFWISGFDIIYALQDMESDRNTGVKSLPASLGSRGAQRVSGITHLLAALSLAGIWLLQGRSAAAGVLALVSMTAMVVAYIPAVPLHARFFPLSAIAGVAGAFVPMLAGGAQ